MLILKQQLYQIRYSAYKFLNFFCTCQIIRTLIHKQHHSIASFRRSLPFGRRERQTHINHPGCSVRRTEFMNC